MPTSGLAATCPSAQLLSTLGFRSMSVQEASVVLGNAVSPPSSVSAQHSSHASSLHGAEHTTCRNTGAHTAPVAEDQGASTTGVLISTIGVLISTSAAQLHAMQVQVMSDTLACTQQVAADSSEHSKAIRRQKDHLICRSGVVLP